MKNQKLFNKTIGILVNAYMNDALKHGHGCGCAVGNMVAAAKGLTPKQIKSTMQGGEINTYNDWWRVIHSERFPNLEKIDSVGIYLGTLDIKETGYTVKEIDKIELAFEKINRTTRSLGEDYVDKDPTGYKGLMAVVDVLMEIHECDDEKLREETKELFNQDKELVKV